MGEHNNIDDWAEEIRKQNLETEERAVTTETLSPTEFWNLDYYQTAEKAIEEALDYENTVETLREGTGQKLNTQASAMVAATQLIGKTVKETYQNQINTYDPENKGKWINENQINQGIEEVFETLTEGGTYMLQMTDIKNGIDPDTISQNLGSYGFNTSAQEVEDSLNTLEQYDFVENVEREFYEMTEKGEGLKNLMSTLEETY